MRRLATNATYTTQAASELREHKKELAERIAKQSSQQKGAKAAVRSQLKQQLLEADRFQFSDRVRSSQTERPLVSFASNTRGGSINTESVKRTCNLWNNLYNVSPSAEEARAGLQRDYEGRMSVTVGTCVPCPNVDVNRCVQAERDTREAKRSAKEWPTPKQRQIMIRKQSRFDMEVQLDMDGLWSDLDSPAAASDVEESDGSIICHTQMLALIDYARPKIAVNRAKKLAAKARRCRQQQLELNRKQRSSSDHASLGGSSGYDSGSEDGAEKGEAKEAASADTDGTDCRLVKSVEAALSEHRPAVMVQRDAAEIGRIAELFSEASLDSALVTSSSTPRKLAVLLHPDVSEAVVFEEVVSEAHSDVVQFSVHHACSPDGKAAMTSAGEVASQKDPFEFLVRRLTSQTLQRGHEAQRTSAKPSSACVPIAGWRPATAMSESDARLAAIRALPMFNRPTVGCLDVDTELIPATDCEICCQEVPVDAAVNSFADGSTMLSECGHRFCNRCWLQHVAGSIARGRADVTCPGFQCKTPLDAATLLWFCPSDLVSALASAAFRTWLSDRSDQRRQRRLCPGLKCGRVLESRAGVNAVCECSGRGLCVGCGQEPHWPSDCATAAKYHAKMKSYGHEKLALTDLNAQTDVNAKQCPTCFLIMEKGVGCNHMSCPCGEHFCWWCGQPMRSHSGGPCFGSQNNKRSRSEFRVQRVFTAQDSVLVPNSQQSRLYCAAMKVRISRASSGALKNLESSKWSRLSSLFASYYGRTMAEKWSIAERRAADMSNRIVRAAAHASYLVEYSYTFMEGRKKDRRAGAAVRALGSHIAHLVDTMSAEAKERSRLGYRGPKLTRLACERLIMMLGYLESSCRQLYCIVTNQRDRRGITVSTRMV